MNSQETVNGIIENNKASFSGVKSFGFPVFDLGGYSVQDNLGNVRREEINISLPEPDNFNLTQIEEALAGRTTSALRLKCSGKSNSISHHEFSSHKCPMNKRFFVNP